MLTERFCSVPLSFSLSLSFLLCVSVSVIFPAPHTDTQTNREMVVAASSSLIRFCARTMQDALFLLLLLLLLLHDADGACVIFVLIYYLRQVNGVKDEDSNTLFTRESIHEAHMKQT